MLRNPTLVRYESCVSSFIYKQNTSQHIVFIQNILYTHIDEPRETLTSIPLSLNLFYTFSIVIIYRFSSYTCDQLHHQKKLHDRKLHKKDMRHLFIYNKQYETLVFFDQIERYPLNECLYSQHCAELISLNVAIT